MCTLATISEIFSSDVVEIRGEGNIESCLSSFFDGSHEKPAEIRTQVQWEWIVTPNRAIDCSGMQGIHADTSSLGTAGQFKGEQNICEFRAGVSPQRKPEVQRVEGFVVISV